MSASNRRTALAATRCVPMLPCVAVVLCLTMLPHVAMVSGQAPRPEAPPLADATWVGVWVVHEPDHGSYQGTEYRFLPDGELALVASVDTNAHGAERQRVLGRVALGRRTCHFGRRWAPDARANRVRIDGICSDGVERTIVLELDARALASTGAESVPRVVEVGGRRGYRFVSSFPAVMFRYARDVSERYFAPDRHGVRFYAADEDPWSTARPTERSPVSLPVR